MQQYILRNLRFAVQSAVSRRDVTWGRPGRDCEDEMKAATSIARHVGPNRLPSVLTATIRELTDWRCRHGNVRPDATATCHLTSRVSGADGHGCPTTGRRAA